MKVSEIPAFIGGTCVQTLYTDTDIQSVYTSDLLSDVLGNAPDNCILITIQAHRNTVAVATTKDSPAIIVCNDRPIPADMISAAEQEHIAVFLTDKNQYTISGMLYKKLDGAR